MSCALRVRWTLVATRFPRPWRACARCGTQRPFACSGKFRLNANGKRLDAWLVYKCSVCDDTWNHTLFERRNARDLDPDLLAALEMNDAALVSRFAFDIAALRRAAPGRGIRGTRFAQRGARRQAENTGAIGHRSRRANPIAIRLDRLLAVELGLSRARIDALAKAGHIIATASLNRPVQDGSHVEIVLRGEYAGVVLQRAERA